MKTAKTSLINNDLMYEDLCRNEKKVGSILGHFKTERGAKQSGRAFWKREGESDEIRIVILSPMVSGFHYSGKFRTLMMEKK